MCEFHMWLVVPHLFLQILCVALEKQAEVPYPVEFSAVFPPQMMRLPFKIRSEQVIFVSLSSCVSCVPTTRGI